MESINSNYSYKYFGKGEVVSIYNFIDESYKLFYSTVISSSEREAAFVIDGLIHNDVVKSTIHSTDSHGYSEIIFATTYLLDIFFAPRIKNFEDQYIYGFENPSFYKNFDYKIIPNKKINFQIINNQWDEILRLIVTLKSNETTASRILQRLSSYSRQHPTYRALKELGRIMKSIFLLKYIDDSKLRQLIHKQLNKLKSSNKFGKAIFYCNNQEFLYATKEEQLIAVGCERLIENCIICWNYLYISKRFCNLDSKKDKINLLNDVEKISILSWYHINLYGEYDFSKRALNNKIDFNLPEILELKIL